jgi:4'-phosphopantetheinyl transferase
MMLLAQIDQRVLKGVAVNANQPQSIVRWNAPPTQPTLNPLQLDLWLADLTQPYDTSTLTDDEQARAARYLTLDIGRTFAAARVFLRDVLAHYTNSAAASLTIANSPAGKPALAGFDLEFSLSHSGKIALLGVTRGQQLGVDLESLDKPVNLSQVGTEVLSQDEMTVLRALAEPDQPAAFYRYWTVKEAIGKAMGTGLAYDTRALTLDPPGAFGTPYPVCGMPLPSCLTALELAPIPGYHAACAATSGIEKFQCWEWKAQ